MLDQLATLYSNSTSVVRFHSRVEERSNETPTRISPASSALLVGPQCRTQGGGGGGAEGHVPPPPPPEEAMSALNFFFHVLLKEKVGAQIEL